MTTDGGGTPSPRGFCVYTALIGGYETLNEQPAAATSGLPFICFTDDPGLRSTTWQIRVVPTLFGLDAIRSHRAIKIRAHHYLPEFDGSLYIDNSVVLSAPPERLVELFLAKPGFCLATHSYRSTLLDEFLEVARTGLDDQGRIFEQLNHYTIDCGDVLQEKPYWNGLLLRSHGDPVVRTALEIWAAHVLRYSRRDQLSINVAFRKAGLVPQILPLDNFTSPYHSWPHAPGRDRSGGTRAPAASFSPPGARIRELELHVEALRRELEEERGRTAVLRSSLSWRVTRPPRVVARSLPGLLRKVRGGLTRVLRDARSGPRR